MNQKIICNCRNTIKQFSAFLIVCILFIMFSLLFFYDFNQKNLAYISNRTFETLHESSLQQITTFQSKLDGQYAILETFASNLTQLDYEDNNAMLKLADTLTNNGVFNFVGIIDVESAECYFNTGKILPVGDRFYYTEALKGHKAIEYVISKVDGMPVIVLSVPVINEMGQVVGIVNGSYETSGLAKLLVSEAYGRNSYSYVCDSNGNIIIESYHENDLYFSDNIFDVFDYAIMEGNSKEELKNDLRSGKDNTFSYQIKDQVRYATYTPLGINDWTIFSIVPEIAVQEQLNHYWMLMFILSIKFTVLFILFMFVLIWRERKVQSRLRAEHDRYEFLESLTNSVLFEGDFNTKKLVFNKNDVLIFGEKIKCESILDLKKIISYVHTEDRDLLDNVINSILSGKPQTECELRLIHKNKDVNWFCIQTKTVFDYLEKPHKVYGRIYSINEQKNEYLSLMESAQTDSLTKLYNRESIMQKINQCIDYSAPDALHAFYIIDIDNFKAVNDKFGHAMGDKVIQQVALKIRQVIEQHQDEDKNNFVGRLGGDEFIIFLCNLENLKSASESANILCKEISKIRLDNTMPSGSVSCSIGIACYPNCGDCFETLYKNADIALYRAKELGKNQSVIFKDF